MTSVREFVQDLRTQGYSVKFNAKIKGISGHVHHVDGLAKNSKDGGKTILWLEKRGDPITEIIEVFAISYDTGAEACYAVDGELGEEERRLVDFYRMRLLSKG